MKNVSIDYLLKMGDGTRTFIPKMSIGGVELDGEIQSGLTVNMGSCGPSQFTIGNAYIPYITASLTGCSYRLQDREILLEMGLVLADGTVEYHKMGYFTVEKPNTDKLQTSFTAYGRLMSRTGGLFENTLEYPASVQSVLDEVARQTGLTIRLNGLAAEGQIFTPFTGELQREVLIRIAGLLGGFVTEDGDGNIVISKYALNRSVTIDTDFCYTYPETNDTEYTVTGLEVLIREDGIDEAGNVIPGEKYASDSVVNVSIQNPYITETLFKTCESNIVGFSYMPAKVEFLGDISLEPWDSIVLIDEDPNNGTDIPCMEIVHVWDGGLVTTITAPGSTETEDNSSFGGPLSTTVEKMHQKLLVCERIVAKSLTVDKADILYAKIADLNATNANITNLSADIALFKTATAETLEAQRASIETLNAKAITTDNLEVNVAKLGYATVETLNVTNANISKLETEVAHISDSYMDRAQVETLIVQKGYLTSAEVDSLVVKKGYLVEAEVETLIAGKGYITSLQTESLLSDYVKTTELEAKVGTFGYLKSTELSSEVAKLGYATVGSLNAAIADISTLQTRVANIGTLMFGSATGSSLTTDFSNAVIGLIGDATISGAKIIDLSAGKIKSGTLDTSLVTVKSKGGNLQISGDVILVKDANRTRVQLGKDANGDYNIYVVDASGKVMFDATGIHSDAIKSPIIENAMVADDADISASKLNIDSLFTEINNSSKTIKSTKIYLDDKKQTLDVAFSSVTNTVTGLGNTVSSQGTAISTIQGQITNKIWQQDITNATDALGNRITTQENKYTELNTAVNGLSATVSSHTSQFTTKADKDETVKEVHRYYQLVQGRKTIMNQQSLPFDEMDGAFYQIITLDLKGNKEYIISWNGTEYTCISSELNEDGTTGIILGNVGLLTGGEDTGEPFVIAYTPDDEHLMALPLDGSTELVLGITEVSSEGAEAPEKPTAFPPSSEWNETEPEGSGELFTTICTVYADGTFSYSDVTKNSAFGTANEAEKGIKNVQTTVAMLNMGLNDVTARVESTESELWTAEDDISSLKSRVNSAEQKITADAIVTTVRSHTSYKNDLSGKVSATEIISKINQSAEAVTISASKINLAGAVSFSTFDSSLASDYNALKSLASATDTAIAQWCYNNNRTYIDGSKIYAKTIKASQIDVDNLFAQAITATGSVSGLKYISTGTDDYGYAAEMILDAGELTLESVDGTYKFFTSVAAHDIYMQYTNETASASANVKHSLMMNGNEIEHVEWYDYDTSIKEFKSSRRIFRSKAGVGVEINKLELTGELLFNTGTTQPATKGIRWTAINSKNPYIGYCTSSTDGTFMVGSIAGTTYTTGLSIGGSSGNLLWKGSKVAVTSDISLSTLGITATAAELNYMDGVTSNVQTQLNNKAVSGHNHDSIYAPLNHTHTLDYRLQAAQSTATGSDANSATATGFHYINGTTNRPSFNQTGATGSDYRILTTAYSTSWLQQIATDFRCDDIFYRRNQNGSWTSWRKLAFADEHATKKQGVYYIVGTGTTAGTWLGSHDDITEYYDGLTIAYKVGIAGASGGTTLNINSLGAIAVMRNASSAVTTHYGVNSVVLLTYTTDSGTGYWKIADYDANNYAYVRQYYTTTNGNYPLLSKYDAGIAETSSYVTKYSRYSNKFYINPSTGKLTAPTFVGALEGNAATATKATQDGSGNVITSTYAVVGHTHNYLPLAGGNISGHVYLTGAQASSSTGNTSQLVFGTPSSNHVAITSNTGAIVINPSTTSTTNQIVLYLNQASKFPKGIEGNCSSATKATQDSAGNVITDTYLKLSGGTINGSLTATDGNFTNLYKGGKAVATTDHTHGWTDAGAPTAGTNCTMGVIICKYNAALKVAYIKLEITYSPTADLAAGASVTIATLPAAVRPDHTVALAVHTASANARRWMGGLTSAGAIALRPSTSVPAGNNFTLHVSAMYVYDAL